MADIFISWGSPDSDAVKPLRDRLRELGLDVWEYSEDMGAGDRIQSRVMKSIEQARIAILCLSDAAVAREWVRTEIAVCVYAMEAGQVEHIIPVKVGALTRANVPNTLSSLDLYIFDLSDPARMGDEMERLVVDIKDTLAQTAPIVMPAALFAMNEAESMHLFAGLRQAYEEAQALAAQAAEAAEASGEAQDETGEPQEGAAATPEPPPANAAGEGEGKEEEEEVEEVGEAGEVGEEEVDATFTEEQEELWKLCKLAGMDDPPDLYEFLQKRYGKKPEELTPFQSGKKIIDVVNEIVGEVNRSRVGDGHRPIFLRWVTDKLFMGANEERRIVREWWRSRDSLLIIDSVSTFYPPIKQKLTTVRAERSALLWLPPYTTHTADMEQALRNAAEAIPALGDEFTDLGMGKNPKRSVSFDTSTSLALRVWLRRALLQVNDESGALEGNVKAVNSGNPPPGDIGNRIFRPKGGPK